MLRVWRDSGRGSERGATGESALVAGHREACDWHAERRAVHIGQAVLVAELHGGRVASLLVANADLQVRPGGASLLDGHRDELADAVLIDGLERIGGPDLRQFSKAHL